MSPRSDTMMSRATLAAAALAATVLSSTLLASGASAAATTVSSRSTKVDSTSVKYQYEEVPSWVISLYTPEGEELLYAKPESVVRRNAMRIFGNLEVQQTQTWCGIATAVTAFNSLQIERGLAPLEPFYYPYALFTQPTWFQNECVLNITTPKEVSAQGVDLDQLTKMVQCYSPGPDNIELATGVHAKEEYANVDEMRQALVDSLERGNERVLMNYQRREFKPYGGHWSPLAAYNKDKDMFLIADVESYLYPPVWMTAEDLYNSVITIDSATDRSRGFVFVQGAIVN